MVNTKPQRSTEGGCNGGGAQLQFASQPRNSGKSLINQKKEKTEAETETEAKVSSRPCSPCSSADVSVKLYIQQGVHTTLAIHVCASGQGLMLGCNKQTR